MKYFRLIILILIGLFLILINPIFIWIFNIIIFLYLIYKIKNKIKKSEKNEKK